MRSKAKKRRGYALLRHECQVNISQITRLSFLFHQCPFQWIEVNRKEARNVSKRNQLRRKSRRERERKKERKKERERKRERETESERSQKVS